MTTPVLPATRDSAAAMQVLADVVTAQHGGDEAYFRNQAPRYERTLQRIQALQPLPCRVLDIGSHYLHQGVLLSQLGHDVTGMDIGLFTGAAFVQERARRFGIHNTTVDVLETGDFLHGQEGRFDLIVFTEILEHVTFNPVRFWARIYELLSPTGMVYLSTPNALRPMAWLRQLFGLFSLRGIGLGVDEIMGNVTYGHHWKEYSAREIRRYFALLSSDFSVATRWYSTDLTHDAGLKTQMKKLLALVPCWRSDIEAVIRRSGHDGFAARAPQLRMQQPASSTGG